MSPVLNINSLEQRLVAGDRADQDARWMWAMIRDRLEDAFKTAPGVAALVPELETAVRQGQLPASAAADRLLAALGL